jgi:carbamoyl-phosphate synthase large subunit
MYIFNSHEDLDQLPPILKKELVNSTATFLVEDYIEQAIEYDVDLIRDVFGNCELEICEHIEYAGIHSGDSGMITPPVHLTQNVLENLKKVSKDLAKELNVIGPINFQFAVKNQNIYCIEANPRGSRTIPFLSKAHNISLPDIAVKAMLGESIAGEASQKSNMFAVKQSTFPFDRFLNDDILLGPKMRSTGETMGFDQNKHAAIVKSYLGNYPKLNTPGKILFSLSDTTKSMVLPYLNLLQQMGHKFLATPGTYQFIINQGLKCQSVSKLAKDNNALIQVLKDSEMRIVINTPSIERASKSDGEIIRNYAIQNAVPCFTNEENIKLLLESLLAFNHQKLSPVALQEVYIQ